MNVRLSPEEKILFQQAATLASLSLSEWVRKVLLAAAQPVRTSEPGEGVLRMEKGKYVPILPEGLAEAFKHGTVISPVITEPERFNNPLPPQLPVTAPPPPPDPEPLPEPVPVVTPVPQPTITTPPERMSMVDRMYAIIEARQGKPAADFWLMTNKKKI